MKAEHTILLRTLSLMVMGLAIAATAPARAASLDAKESDELRQARQLYKSGQYQEAADIFSRLSAAHPDLPTFARNAGAAYYYLKKPDPALSNLREYLRVQKRATAEDREEVLKWIAEMEQLRAQTPAPGTVTAPGPAPVPGEPTSGAEGTSVAPTGGSTTPMADTPMGYPPAGSPPGYPPGYGYESGSPPPPGYPPQAAPTAGGYAYPVAPAAGVDGAAPTQGQYPPSYAYGPGPAPVGAVPAVQGGVAQQPPAAQARDPLPWILGGAGVACLAMGGVFTYLYQSAYSDTRAQYDPDRESAGRTYSYLQFVGYGLGVAGVATAAVMLFGADGGPARPGIALRPALGPRVAGANLSVRY